MTITAQMIKELRERTGVGMSKCKKALEETSGNMDEAINNLRKAGMAAAVKKEGRETKEGLIATAETEEALALVEIMAETDFVVNNEHFRSFLQSIADEAAKTRPANLEEFLAQPYSQDSAQTIEEYRASVIQKVGENIQIKRVLILSKDSNSSLGVYLHLGGKIACVVEMAGSNDLQELARGIAMHVAAAQPQYLSEETIPADVIANEREIARSQVQGKPENIIEKIVDGKLKAFYDDHCLMNQAYIRDDKVTIAQLVADKGNGASIKQFIRWSIGEN